MISNPQTVIWNHNSQS